MDTKAANRPIPVASRFAAGRHATLLPGVALCGAVTAAAFVVERVEAVLFGRAWLEALVLAILIGTAVRSLWTPGVHWQAGIAFSAKMLLEVAVMLLGAALSFRTLADIGPGLLFGIAGVVLLVVAGSFMLCRLLGLPKRMSMLVACGNSICGNSAIAAVAPVIGADGDDVAASIAFTAVLGVLVVLGLPALVPLLGFSVTQFGVFAGLTVYAVPQVIAATAPVGAAAIQLGTLVKLVRVLMLGPVVLVLSFLASRLRDDTDEPAPQVTAGDRPQPGHLPVHKLMPWFIVAFLALATLHTLNLIPAVVLAPTAMLANVLTILSMAALGLGVDVRVVARAGGRVTGAVVASLALLGGVSFVLIHGLGVL
ncbi:putative sulfate exporter family transporter [Lichenihabitans sp. Uapishka_5]|nr:putative sulfate exporter family transporter [Lichenihabitans sp. Uapishka_5]MDX7952363.1 putative sulfate exporter family transporter [Lichenihabitans sp. Uapishka_5]